MSLIEPFPKLSSKIERTPSQTPTTISLLLNPQSISQTLYTFPYPHSHHQTLTFSPPYLRTDPLPLKAFNSDNAVHGDGYGVDDFNFDAFLSLAEFICLGSWAIVSIGFAVNYVLSGPHKVLNVWLVLGNRVLGWQVVVLVVGVVIGAWKQWRRIYGEEEKGGVEIVDLVGRIEKLEEDLLSSATIIRTLSRQLEKLGIRFRVTRKSLKDPIAETDCRFYPEELRSISGARRYSGKGAW